MYNKRKIDKNYIEVRVSNLFVRFSQDGTSGSFESGTAAY